MEGFYPSISAEPSGQGRGAALLNDAEARKAELVTEIADKEGDLAELDSQLEDVKLDIEDEQDRLECLRQRADGVARCAAGGGCVEPRPRCTAEGVSRAG